MPPKRTTKNKQTTALRKTKHNVKKSNKIEMKKNVSATRFPKPNFLSKNLNYVNYPDEISSFKDCKDEVDESFNLSPAYLCECTLQTSASPENSGTRLANEYYLNEAVSESNSSQKKKPPNKRINKTNYINNKNESINPAFVCESVLETDNLQEISIVHTSINDFQKTKQSRSGKKNNGKVNNQCLENPKKYSSKRKLQSKDMTVILEPDHLNAISSQNSLLKPNLPKKETLGNSRKKQKTNKENSLGHDFSPLLLCESIIQSEEALVTSKLNISEKWSPLNKLSKTNIQSKGKFQQRSKKVISNEMTNQAQECRLEKLRKNNINISLIPKTMPSKDFPPQNSSSKKSLQNKVITRQPKKNLRCNGRNNEYLEPIPAKQHTTSVKSESRPSLGKCSNKNSLEQNLQSKVSLRKRRTKLKCNEINCKEDSHKQKNRIGSTLHPKVSLKVKYDPSVEFCSKKNLLGSDSRNMKKTLDSMITTRSKKLNTNAQPTKMRDAALNSEKLSTLSEINYLEPSCPKNVFLQNSDFANKTSQKPVKELKKYEINNPHQNLIPLNLESTLKPSKYEITEVLQSTYNPLIKNETTKPVFISSPVNTDKQISQYESEFDNSLDCDDHSFDFDDNTFDCDSETSEPDKNQINLEKQLHSNYLTNHNGVNKNSGVENKITFIECDFIINDSTLGDPLALVEDECEINETADEADPLMCHSAELHELERNNKQIHCVKDILENDKIQNSIKARDFFNNEKIHDIKDNPLADDKSQTLIEVKNFVNKPDVSPLEYDLELECNLEYLESCRADLTETGYSLEDDVLGTNVPSMDLMNLQSFRSYSLLNLELKYDFETVSPCSPNFVSESTEVNRDNVDKEETKNVTHKGDIFIVVDREGQVSFKTASNKSNDADVYDNVKSSKKQTEEEYSLQCLGLRSCLFDGDEKYSLQCLGLRSTLFDADKNYHPSSSNTNIQCERKLNNSFELMDEKNDAKAITTSENGFVKAKISDNLSPGEVEPLREHKDTSSLKDSPLERKCYSMEFDELSTPLLNTSGNCKKEEYGDNSLNHLDWKYSRQNLGNSSEEISSSGDIKDSKEMITFHENKVLKVLLRRLEDEDIFKVWKENGLASLPKRPSCSKATLLQKKTLPGSSIQKYERKKKSFKCQVCQVCFKRRERYWEHKASKCDRIRVFGCGNCNNKYILKKMLEEHRKKCISLKYYRCQKCSKLFNSQQRLDEHNASQCDTQKAFECNVCGRGFIFKRLFLMHTDPVCTSLRRYKCSICQQLFRSEDIRAHKIKEHSNLSSVLCEFCGKLVSRKTFNIHINTHTDVPLFRCRVCKSTFQSQEAIDYHHEQHHSEDKPPNCADCGKVFPTIGHLKKHVIGVGKFYKCNTCGRGFRNQICFRAHEQSHIKTESSSNGVLDCQIKLEPDDQEPYSYLQISLDEQPLKCIECEEIFSERSTLEQHVQCVHQSSLIEMKTEPSQNSPIDKTKLFKCEKCVCCFSQEIDFINHLQKSHSAPYDIKPVVEDKPYKCEKCGVSFRLKIYLNRHCRRLHNAPRPSKKIIVTSPTPEKPYACHICRICFGTKRNLSRHHSRKHRVMSDKPDEALLFPCAFCNKTFKTEDQFQEHAMEHSKDGYSVKANIKMEVNSLAETENKCLKSNVHTTTQGKLYICDICGNSFGRKENLSRHRKRMHQVYSSNPLYSCSFCNEKFKTNSELENHSFHHLKKEFSPTADVNEEVNLISTIKVNKEDTLFLGCNSHQSNGKLGNIKLEDVNDYIEVKGTLNGIPQSINYSSNNDALNIKEEDTSDSVEVKGTQVGLPESISYSGIEDAHKARKPRFSCRECGKKFNTSYSRKRHVCLHKIKTLQNTMGRTLHACEYCGVIFLDRWRLNRHLLSHSSQVIKCDVCKKCFTTQLKLNVHMLVHGITTTEEPTFNCSICSKLFPSIEKLKNHLVLHTEKNPYQCSKCDKKFTASYSLKRHNQNSHGDKCFSCKYCKMAFVSFSSLNQHVMYVHKKTVSLAEYVLKIDEDQTSPEADNLTLYNLQGENITEINLQPQVFANLNNLFSNLLSNTPEVRDKPSDTQQESAKPNEIAFNSPQETGTTSSLEVSGQIRDVQHL